MVEIVPTLLCQTADELRLGLERWQGLVRLVQIDLADGVFVANTLPGSDDINALTTELNIEVHLMVNQPVEYVVRLLENPQIQHFIIHIESEGDGKALIDSIRSHNRQVSLALKPETLLSEIEPFVGWLDGLLLLGVNPGFNGSPFIPEVVERVAKSRQRWPHLRIEVDGGMNLQTAPLVAKAGADRIAVGSFFADGDATSKLNEMRSVLNGESRL